MKPKKQGIRILRWVLYIVIQCTWGAIQTFVGLIIFLIMRRCRHFWFHGAIVTEWSLASSLSMGMFVFVARSLPRVDTKPYHDLFHRVLVHEYGHTIQSLLLGPLYLLVIGLPSVVWCGLPVLEERRRKHHRSYYSFYTERWANAWGEHVTKQLSPGQR